MTIEEAVGLVLEAARMADGAATYVLDMGEPVRIVDLVRQLRAAAQPADDVAVRFTGLRPGEKLARGAVRLRRGRTLPTDHPRISRTVPSQPAARLPGRAPRPVRRGVAQPGRRGARAPASPGARVLASTDGRAGPGAGVASPYPDDY